MTGRIVWPSAVSIKKEPFLWVAAALFCFLLFLYITFPFGALQSRILSEISRNTGWTIRAADWSVGFPFGIEWHDVTLAKPPVPALQIDTLRLMIPLLVQFTGQRKLEGIVQFPGGSKSGAGKISATVTASSWSFQGPASVQAHVHQVDLSTLVKPFVTKGLLQADIAHESTARPGTVNFAGKGTVNAEVKDLLLEHIPIGQTALPPLAFNHATLTLSCRDASCEVTDMKADGPDGSITAKGQLTLQQPLDHTTLDLTVTILAGAGWAQKSAGLPIPTPPAGTPLIFKLIGTVANPRLSV
ncbi:hypothetical protein W02_00420 [Nitrospira sp. KM1]|nr:hypothetical protein W02_00420 [Nitrospira sp. KM1]